jgi:hypothetical protein
MERIKKRELENLKKKMMNKKSRMWFSKTSLPS